MTIKTLIASTAIILAASGLVLSGGMTKIMGTDHSNHGDGGVKMASDHGDHKMEHGSDHKMEMEAIKIGDLEITAAMIRATLPNAPVSAGYMTISNKGKEAERLIGGSAEFAGKVEVHEMAMQDDVMKMRELEEGLEIPAEGEVTLKSGGLHIMFMKLKEQLEEGQTHKIKLEFEKAGTVELELPVKKLAKSSHGDQMKHDHTH